MGRFPGESCGRSRGQAVLDPADEHFSVEWHPCCRPVHPMPRCERIDGRRTHRTAIRSWRGFGHSKARQEAGPSGDFRSIKLSNKDPSLPAVDPDALLARKANVQPRPQPSSGGTCLMTTAICPDRGNCRRHPSHGPLVRNGCANGDGG